MSVSVKVFEKGKVTIVTLDKGEHVVGGSSSAAITLHSPEIPPEALKLTVGVDDRCVVENIGSRNARLDGKEFREATEVHDRGQCVIDGDVKLKFFISKKSKSKKTEHAALVTEASSDADDASSHPFEPVELLTRVATEDEIENLRKKSYAKARIKFVRKFLGLGLAALFLVLLWYLGTSDRERDLSWPEIDEGFKAQDASLPGRSFEDGFYSLYFPDWKNNVVKTSKNWIEVESRIGRDYEVPFYLNLFTLTDKRFLRMDRIDVVKQILLKVVRLGGYWNLSSISKLQYLGADNGIPCYSVNYRREFEGKSRYGIMTIFINADTATVFRVSVPSVEASRVKKLFSVRSFLRMSPEYELNYWEGGSKLLKGDTKELYSQAETTLMKMSPTLWVKTYEQLRTVLVRSLESGDQKKYEKAMKLLRDLRLRQKKWYNTQKLAYNSQKIQNDEKNMALIKETCKGVFSSPDDLRYLLVRKATW